jgi:hypothetical protein
MWAARKVCVLQLQALGMALICSSNNIATHGDAMTRMTVKAATATTMMTMTVE